MRYKFLYKTEDIPIWLYLTVIFKILHGQNITTKFFYISIMWTTFEFLFNEAILASVRNS